MADIHNLERRYRRVIKRVGEAEIDQGNKEKMLAFHDYLISENIGFSKTERYLLDLLKFDKLLGKQFETADEQDIRRVISVINQAQYSEHTKRGFKLIVRRFYRFLRGCDKDDPHPPEVKWMSMRMSHTHSKLPEELLTEEDFLAIIRHCETIRDKALVSVLAESGARIGEIASMQIKHIAYEKHGARLTVRGKTGMRKILVVSSAPLLQQWINEHPKNDNPDAYLWYHPRGEFLCYNAIRAILQKAARRAGIKKRIHPHLFRHSRATQLASIMSESSMKQYLGWVQGSKMAAIYVHMSGKDVDGSILRANGIEIKEEEKGISMKPLICMRCETVNPPTNKFCKLCGFVLNDKEAQEIIKEEAENQNMNQLLDMLLKDKSILHSLANKIKESGVLVN